VNSFYRYFHSFRFDEKRKEVYIPDTGGICFYVVDEGYAVDENGHDSGRKIRVSFSICEDGMKFNKDVAKKIAVTRYENGHFYTLYPESVSTKDIAASFVSHWQQLSKEECDDSSVYAREELIKLVKEIIVYTLEQRLAKDLEKLYYDTTLAMNIERLYHAKSLQG
jgi:hypothetical protein